MVLGSRDTERFWIALTVRFAFGFMFLIAAMNILFFKWDDAVSVGENFSRIKANVTAFVDIQTKGYEDSWVNVKYQGGAVAPATGTTTAVPIGMTCFKVFVAAMPVVFFILSVLLLSGLFLRPALRASAIYLILLGLGKYLVDFKTGVTQTTLQDFMYAMFITLTLFVLSKENTPVREEVQEEVAAR